MARESRRGVVADALRLPAQLCGRWLRDGKLERQLPLTALAAGWLLSRETALDPVIRRFLTQHIFRRSLALPLKSDV